VFDCLVVDFPAAEVELGSDLFLERRGEAFTLVITSELHFFGEGSVDLLEFFGVFDFSFELLCLIPSFLIFLDLVSFLSCTSALFSALIGF
jgi:hypothetical protein